MEKTIRHEFEQEGIVLLQNAETGICHVDQPFQLEGQEFPTLKLAYDAASQVVDQLEGGNS